ncbi:unnamed protein product [Brassicogethes aeneus]|uniref:Major facilitator superfamily (MFS) profile domain-containing protein n=1 Tax=Brassicogethes aeneus TaxID=1431903 RepID=A0A9P0FR65_BRAAE|nr:unnamed protein product [Brassicogethes aeneus]
MENKAPLESLSNIAPSLESSPSRKLYEEALTLPIVDEGEKSEVKFDMSSSSSDDDDEDHQNPKIPDGGWGWMIVFASLILSMIADGISLSFGLLYVEFLHEFGSSKSTTSWIGSLFMAVPLVTGPIMSAFVDKYGCRSMTIIGGLISAIGFIVSSRMNSIGIMYLTFGTLSGLGLGLCYVTAVVSIAFWFDKKRTLAVGLGAAGTGIGTFVFSPLTTYLIKEYGWRGTTLLLSGSFLNICVCGALMRDPDWIIQQNKTNERSLKSGKSSKTSLVSISSNFQNVVDINEIKEILKSGKDAEYLLQSLETSLKDSTSVVLRKTHQSVVNLPTFIKENEKVPVEVLEQLSSNKKLYNIILENYPSLLLCRSTSDRGLDKIAENVSMILDRVPVTFSMKLKKAEKEKPKAPIHQYSLPEETLALEVEEPLLEKPQKVQNSPPKRNHSFPWFKNQPTAPTGHQSYFKNIKFHRQSLVHRGAIFNNQKYRLRASSCPNIYKVSMAHIPKEREEKWYSEFVDLVKGMLDFSLFLELHFFLLSLSTIIFFVWFIVPYFYLAEHMLRYRYTEEEASLTMSVIGITSTIGMVSLGWAGDQPWMSITKTYAVSLILCGFSCAGIMFFTENFVLLLVNAGLFGLFLSSSFSFTPGILVELVPLDRFTIAYGLQLLCMGIGNLLGPPYAGHLFDVSGSWALSFYQAAIWIVVSGVLVGIIPYTKNRKIIGKGPVEKELVS